MRISVVGIGMGPQHVTPEAADVLRSSAFVVAADKGADDPLLDVRREVAAAHGLPVVAVPDPERDRQPADYAAAVEDWHTARASAWAEAISAREGDPAFLVWGDPAFYDSTIRVVDRVAEQLDAQVQVIAGISAPSLLAARFGTVLHEVGGPVHVTTARRLAEAVASGERNIVVMLTGRLDLTALGDWTIWWGANLGADSETLVHGRVGDVLPEIERSRMRVKARAGWVLDVYLLRAPADPIGEPR